MFLSVFLKLFIFFFLLYFFFVSLPGAQSVLSQAGVQKFSSLSCLLLFEVRVGRGTMLGGRLLEAASSSGASGELALETLGFGG